MEEEKYPSKLTKGSKYRIISRGGKDEQFVSIGEFMGYVQFGQDSGLCLKLLSEDQKMDGMLRIIPAMSVLIIDVLNYKHEEDRLKKEPDSIFYN
ncbi:MAG: hypothetical protein ABR986_05290 [Methanomassiliicoccales archaeon]|jgi:hypothetical protein